MKIKFKEGIKVITQQMLGSYYKKLTSVEIPNTVIEFCESAFLECKNLENITIPSSVEKIGMTCFYSCNSLKEIEIPNSVKSLGLGCFYFCRNLNKVKLSNSINSIGYACFEGCQNLSEIKIPDGVKKIGKRAFVNCRSLAKLEIPSSVETIGSEAFLGCSSLKYNEFDNGLYLGNQENPYMVFVKIKNRHMQSCIINDNTKIILDSAFFSCTKLNCIVIPNSVKKIGDSAFRGCNNLTHIDFSNSISCLSNNIFHSCVGLKNIILPSNIKNINLGAFSYCSNLESIKLPDSLKKIDEYTFSYCGGLKFLELPKSLEGKIHHSFEGCSKLDLFYLYDNKEMITSLNNEINSVFAPNILLKNVPSRNKFIFSKGFIKNYKNYDIDKAVFNGYKNYISKNRFKFYGRFDESICKFLIENKIIKLDEIDSLLESATKNNLIELSAMLLDYKNKNFTGEEIEKQFERDLFEEKKITLTLLKNFWTVKKIESGNLEISNYKGNEIEIEIPYRVGNHFVEKISKLRNPFYNGLSNVQIISKVKKIFITDGIKEIGDNAFENCINLKMIKIPSSVKTIGQNILKNCKNTVFEVEKESYAEEYAKENKIQYVVC